MNKLLERYLTPLAAPGDDGGSGAGAGSGGEGGAGTGGSADPGAGAAGGGGSGDGGGDPGAAAAAAGTGQPYRPDGLPDTMFGKDDRETIDKMKTALDGYRGRDSARGVPAEAAAYQNFEGVEIPDTVKPHITALSKDPLFGKVSEIALAEKAPVGLMQKLTVGLYEAAAEAGILEAPVDAEKERAALLPESAKSLSKADQDKAIDARLEKNENFVKLMTQRGLDAKAAEHGLLMLMDTAAGNQFIEFFANMATGGDQAQPGAMGAGSGGGRTADQLRAELAKPEMQAGHPSFSKQKYEALMQDYRKVHGAASGKGN